MTDLPEPPEVAEDLQPPENGMSTQVSPAVMFTDVHVDDLAQEQQHGENISQAFAVRPFSWKAQALAPFAIDREGDWMRHRELLGEVPLHEIIRQPVAMLPDALRVLWFCSVEPVEWLSIPAMVQDGDIWRRRSGHERAMLVEEKIRAWAVANVERTEGTLAVDVFYDVYQSAQSTRAVAKPSEHQKEDRSKN